MTDDKAVLVDTNVLLSATARTVFGFGSIPIRHRLGEMRFLLILPVCLLVHLWRLR